MIHINIPANQRNIILFIFGSFILFIALFKLCSNPPTTIPVDPALQEVNRAIRELEENMTTLKPPTPEEVKEGVENEINENIDNTSPFMDSPSTGR